MIPIVFLLVRAFSDQPTLYMLKADR